MGYLKVWIRVGDQDDYHDFDSVAEAADEIHEELHSFDRCPDPVHGCTGHKVDRYVGPALHGIVVARIGLEGDNGISFYWGNDDGQFEAEISYHELEVIQRTLSA